MRLPYHFSFYTANEIPADWRKKANFAPKTIMGAQQSMFDEPLFDYFFVLEPSIEITAEVKRLKQLMHQVIGISAENLHSKAHLTLFEYQEAESEEAAMIRKTAKALENTSCFLVELDGVETFVHGKKSRSVVLKVKEAAPVETIKEMLRRELQLKPEKITPHVTIARNIPVNEFALLGSTEAFDFRSQFVCSRVTILKRPAQSKQKYTVFHEAPLR